MRSTLALAVLLSLTLVACAADPNDPEAAPSTFASALTGTDTSAILALVNYPGTTEAVLHDAARLDARAAHNIVAYRVGPDGIEPSMDDLSFGSIAELDAISYVGDTAFQKLQAYGVAHPPPAGEDVEGVHFAGWESEAVVWGVNHAETSVLDGLLDRRASAALVAARPLASVTAMGPLSYVGTSALGRLRGQAGTWWNQMRGTASLAGTFDGIAFDAATAEIALAIANQATSVQLSQHAITGTPASMIGTHRPYTTLAQVAALSGVGPVTMTSLRSWAASGTWGAAVDPGMCIPSVEASVAPSLPALLFLSESDRPIDFVSFPGAGTSAPTAASVLALVGGTSTETRAVENYFVAFEPSSSTADPNAAATVEAAMRSQLTDLIYVAVHGSDRALVDVYLVGRTACGDLVGLHAVAVET